MKANRLVSTLFFALVTIVFQLPAQQTETDRKLLEELHVQGKKGDAQSQLELGTIFYFGKFGVAKDYVVAVKWYRKATEQNCAQAQNNLGVCYDNGNGVAQDEVEAVKWYRKAAEQNDAAGQCNLGFCYAQGKGTTKNGVEAAKYFRKAAEQDDANAQFNLAVCYSEGEGVVKDVVEAAKWLRKASELNHVTAQYHLGSCYEEGRGLIQDAVEAVKWYRKAAEKNYGPAQSKLGFRYVNGVGVARDVVEGVNWFRKAAEQNDAAAQCNLGICYSTGDGVVKDEVEGYKWLLLATAQGFEKAKQNIRVSENRLSREQIALGQQLARNFKPREMPPTGGDSSGNGIAPARPESSGTGFFITADGFLITNEHVIRDGAQVRLITSAGFISAKVVKVDAANDLALLKAEGNFSPLPVAASRGVKLGGTVATVGFPNIGLQGFAPKLAKGEIASLSGAGDDARYFQISVPVQPGNSGGALVDERGNVVGVVSAKLNASAALRSSGALPENVNYAVKSSYLLSFLESVPDVASKLKEASGKEKKFEDVVKEAEQAAVLVLVY